MVACFASRVDVFLDVSHPRGLKGACSGMGARTLCVCERERERESE